MKTVIIMVAIQDGAILLVLKKDTWMLPGGEPVGNETDLECLKRKIDEMLPDASAKIGECYDDFESTIPHRNETVCVTVFLGRIDGDITPGAEEISDARFFTRDELAEISTSEITRNIIASLIDDKLF